MAQSFAFFLLFPSFFFETDKKKIQYIMSAPVQDPAVEDITQKTKEVYLE